MGTTETERTYAERRLALMAAEILVARRAGEDAIAERLTRERDAYAREAYRMATR